MEKDYTFLYDILINGKPNLKIADDKQKHIKIALEEMNKWCDLFIKRNEEEKNKKQFLKNIGDKPISNITSFQFEEDRIFKDEKEIKLLIINHWFAYLLRYRLPKFLDGKTLRANRKRLIKELTEGKLTTNKTKDTLVTIFNRLKNI